MTLENYEYHNELDNTRNLHEKCKKYMYHHAVLTMNDGSSFDGIIEDVDGDRISVLIGEDAMERESDDLEDRQYFGDDYGYGRPRRRFRRFRRQFFPLAALAALSLLPYSYPYSYYPPYYPPYYPYY